MQPVLVLHGGTGIKPNHKRLGPMRRNLRAISAKVYDYLKNHNALEILLTNFKKLRDTEVPDSWNNP